MNVKVFAAKYRRVVGHGGRKQVTPNPVFGSRPDDFLSGSPATRRQRLETGETVGFELYRRCENANFRSRQNYWYAR